MNLFWYSIKKEKKKSVKNKISTVEQLRYFDPVFSYIIFNIQQNCYFSFLFFETFIISDNQVHYILETFWPVNSNKNKVQLCKLPSICI